MLHPSIKTRLRLAFLIMALSFLALGSLAIVRMGIFNRDLTDIEHRMLPKIVAAGQIALASGQYRIAEALHILSLTPEEMQRYEAKLTALEAVVTKNADSYQSMINRPEDAKLFAAFQIELARYLDASRIALAQSRRNENEAASLALKTQQNLFDRVNEYLVQMVDGTLQTAIHRVDAGNQLLTESRVIIISATVAVFIFALGLMVYFERVVSRPLNGLATLIRRLASGDLSNEVAGSGRQDEIGECARAVDAITKTLRELTRRLGHLIDGARAGSLAVRADGAAFSGDYAALLTGMNDLIEILSKPLQEVAGVMQKLAAGDPRGRITGAYEGDLRALKANVNRSLDALAGLFGELGRSAEGLAAGNLGRTITGTYQGEFASIKGNINQALADLRDVIVTLQGHASQVAVATTETSAAAHQVAEGASRQLSTLVEVSGAVEQTAAAVGEVSVNAERGRTLASGTVEHAVEGRIALAQLLEIVESTAAVFQRMQQFTGSIARIADKTHVLSLNAGIEAARAGDQGAGFGFVAHQIGRLAEDAAAAAREIETMISQAADWSRRSVETAIETRGVITRIADASREADVSAQAIAAAITEQSAAVASVSRQIEELRAVGEDNAAAAEEISATMEELARMVHEIQGRLDRFSVAA